MRQSVPTDAAVAGRICTPCSRTTASATRPTRAPLIYAAARKDTAAALMRTVATDASVSATAASAKKTRIVPLVFVAASQESAATEKTTAPPPRCAPTAATRICTPCSRTTASATRPTRAPLIYAAARKDTAAALMRTAATDASVSATAASAKKTRIVPLVFAAASQESAATEKTTAPPPRWAPTAARPPTTLMFVSIDQADFHHIIVMKYDMSL